MTDDDKIPPYAVLKARYLALKSLHARPLSDTRRNALFGALIAYSDAEGVCFPGAALLGKVTHTSKPTVLKLLNEFATHALIEFIDPPETGRRARRIRLHPERLSSNAFAVKPELTAKESVAVNPELTASKSFAGSGGYRKTGNLGCVAVKTDPVCGKAWVVPRRKPREVLVPKATTDDSNVGGPLASEKSDVQEHADSPSNDAVLESARGPPTLEQHQIRAHEADMTGDCDGALVSKSGGLYLPWGPYLDPRRVRAMRAELVEMIETLATLEDWPKECRADVLTRTVRGPLYDLTTNFRHFEKRVIEAQCRVAAAELRDSRNWHGEGFEKRMTDKPMTTRSAKKYRNRKQA